MDLQTGNAHDADTAGTGWFIGFSAWTEGLLHVPREAPLHGLCVKWYEHAAGHDSGAALKPLSEGRTKSILVNEGAHFEIDMGKIAGFAACRTVVLQRHGDYAAWGASLYHRWRSPRRSTIATLRWSFIEPEAA